MNYGGTVSPVVTKCGLRPGQACAAPTFGRVQWALALARRGAANGSTDRHKLLALAITLTLLGLPGVGCQAADQARDDVESVLRRLQEKRRKVAAVEYELDGVRIWPAPGPSEGRFVPPGAAPSARPDVEVQ